MRVSASPPRSSASMVLAKVGSGRIGGDGVDLGRVRGKCAREGRLEMLRLDPAERRHAEGAGPVGQQRVVGAGGKGLAFLISCSSYGISPSVADLTFLPALLQVLRRNVKSKATLES